MMEEILDSCINAVLKETLFVHFGPSKINLYCIDYYAGLGITQQNPVVYPLFH